MHRKPFKEDLVKKDFICINERIFKLDAVTSIMFQEANGETQVFFDEDNFINIPGDYTDFICEVLGERVAIHKDEE